MQFTDQYNYSGYMGAAICMILSSWGSAWGTWRAGLGVCHMGVDHPAGVIRNIVPIVMAGVLGIYGLIVSVIITQAISMPAQDMTNQYSSYNGYVHVSNVNFCHQLVFRPCIDSLFDSLFLDPIVGSWSLLWSVLSRCWWNDWNFG